MELLDVFFHFLRSYQFFKIILSFKDSVSLVLIFAVFLQKELSNYRISVHLFSLLHEMDSELQAYE